MEWPRGCAYWREPRIADFLDSCGFRFTHFDGCMYGLRAKTHGKLGMLIRKPWAIAFINSTIDEYLNKTCDRSHAHHPCSGSQTILTQCYTDEIIKRILLASDRTISDRSFVAIAIGSEVDTAKLRPLQPLRRPAMAATTLPNDPWAVREVAVPLASAPHEMGGASFRQFASRVRGGDRRCVSIPGGHEPCAACEWAWHWTTDGADPLPPSSRNATRRCPRVVRSSRVRCARKGRILETYPFAHVPCPLSKAPPGQESW